MKLFKIMQENILLANAEQEARKKAENSQVKLAESERMAELGRLAGAVAHEINRPLLGIALARETINDILNEEGL